ncbi:MAG: hypothetical protein II849_02955 [Bacteroidales bacterium]|nr:hypothetical protein [Bacteroidales bacterium]
MKKLLLMAFLPMALLMNVSCSKDDEDSVNTSLVGTSWECVHSFSVPVVGAATLTMNLAFTDESKCHASLVLPDAIAQLLPINLDGDFDYTFDGKKVVVLTQNQYIDKLELTYAGDSMLIYAIPENLINILGTSELVFHKK